jgi:hypothetical protein
MLMCAFALKNNNTQMYRFLENGSARVLTHFLPLPPLHIHPLTILHRSFLDHDPRSAAFQAVYRGPLVPNSRGLVVELKSGSAGLYYADLGQGEVTSGGGGGNLNRD